jgi:hypothetical protein
LQLTTMPYTFATQYKRLKLLRASIAKTQRLDQAVERIFNIGELTSSRRAHRLAASIVSVSYPPFSTPGFFSIVGVIALAVVGKEQ